MSHQVYRKTCLQGENNNIKKRQGKTENRGIPPFHKEIKIQKEN
jgi:hypothetical protein